jgi:hypothetical protein
MNRQAKWTLFLDRCVIYLLGQPQNRSLPVDVVSEKSELPSPLDCPMREEIIACFALGEYRLIDDLLAATLAQQSGPLASELQALQVEPLIVGG